MEAMRLRRSYYAINNETLVSDETIVQMLEQVLLNVPSAFNAQSTRLVLLLRENHTALWNIVKDVLRQQVEIEKFARTEAKINGSFAAGYGTILFYEDREVVERQKAEMPLYADKCDEYSAQTSAMHQFSVWVLLRNMGFGASLQHYNPLIDDDVAQHWGINRKWRLMAQMPFGKPLAEPLPREQIVPMSERLLMFG